MSDRSNLIIIEDKYLGIALLWMPLLKLNLGETMDTTLRFVKKG